MRHWVTRILIVVVVVGLLIGGCAWITNGRSSGGGSFRTAPVTRQEIVATISATGTVEPEEVIDVGAQVAGQILGFGTDKNGKQVDYGSQVEEGTILAKIDDSVYQSDVASATAQLNAARAGVQRAEADIENSKAKLFQAQRDWDRAKAIDPKSNALAETQYDAYQSAYEAAKAQVDVSVAAQAQAQTQVAQAQANLDRANRNLGYCTIKSPVKGTIVDRRVNIGQTVVASLNAPSLFLLAKDLRRMQVWVSVNEADIGNIHPGQPVSFTVDAYPGQMFKGTVNKIRLNASMTQNVVTYTVEVTTDNSEQKLLPYLTANVSFQVNRREDALVVPNAALRWLPTQEQIAPDAKAEMASAESGGGRGARGAGGGGNGGGGGGRDSQASAGRAGGQHSSTRPTTRPELRPGTVWVRDGEYVRPIAVRTGITDGTNTEVQSDKLPEGEEVVVGEERAQAAAGGSNPFTPQFGGRRGAR